MSNAAASESPSSLVLGIDVGIVHLALALARIDTTRSKIVEVERIEVIDLTRLPHRRVPRYACRLRHDSAEMCDRIAHLLQEYGAEWFDRADGGILIERQPLCGLKSVEQLLFAAYRDRATLVHPCAVHKWLGSNGVAYEQRKALAEARAERHIDSPRSSDAVRRQYYDVLERRHDVADALCMIEFHLATRREAYKRCKRWQSSVARFKRFLYDETTAAAANDNHKTVTAATNAPQKRRRRRVSSDDAASVKWQVSSIRFETSPYFLDSASQPS